MGEADREGVLIKGWMVWFEGWWLFHKTRKAGPSLLGVCVLGLNYASKFIELRDERGMRGRGRHRKGGGIID